MRSFDEFHEHFNRFTVRMSRWSLRLRIWKVLSFDLEKRYPVLEKTIS